MSWNLDNIEKNFLERMLLFVAVLNFIGAFVCLFCAWQYNERKFILGSGFFLGLYLIFLSLEFLSENIRRNNMGIPAKQMGRFGYETTFSYRAAQLTNLMVMCFGIGFVVFSTFSMFG